MLVAVTRGKRRRALRGSEVFFPYFATKVRFDDRRTRERLDRSGISAAPVESYFERLADFAVRARWGRRAVSR